MSRSTYATAPGALTEQISLSVLEKLIEIAKASGITYLALFGSVARNQATPASDVDLAVRFGQPISLLDWVGIRLEMEAVLGRPVDLIPIDSTYAFMRESMFRDLLVLYEASDNKILLETATNEPSHAKATSTAFSYPVTPDGWHAQRSQP